MTIETALPAASATVMIVLASHPSCFAFLGLLQKRSARSPSAFRENPYDSAADADSIQKHETW